MHLRVFPGYSSRQRKRFIGSQGFFCAFSVSFHSHGRLFDLPLAFNRKAFVRIWGGLSLGFWLVLAPESFRGPASACIRRLEVARIFANGSCHDHYHNIRI